MATTTTNLGLTKPDGSDKVVILVLNGNFDKIDEAIGAIRAQQIPAEVITAAVEEYLANADIASGATEAQAAQIEANKTGVGNNAKAISDEATARAQADTNIQTKYDALVDQSVKSGANVTFGTVTATKVVGAVYA